jgi:hypothetical protein
MVWIEGLGDACRELREEYVQGAINLWTTEQSTLYHTHGFARNGIKIQFDCHRTGSCLRNFALIYYFQGTYEGIIWMYRGQTDIHFMY